MSCGLWLSLGWRSFQEEPAQYRGDRPGVAADLLVPGGRVAEAGQLDPLGAGQGLLDAPQGVLQQR